MKSFKLIALTIAASSVLAACGGGGSSAIPDTSGSAVLPPSSSVANFCQSPRTGTDPYNNNLPYPDRQGSLSNEKTWLRSWIDETYLWYAEVPTTLNPASYNTAIDYFNVLKTTAITPSGTPKDQFHFTYPTADWNAILQAGVEFGYGIHWSRSTRNVTPRNWIVTTLEPDSAAAKAGLMRGDKLISVDDADFLNGTDSTTIAILNGGLFPSKDGEIHKFVISRNGSNLTFTIAAGNVFTTPVQNVKTIDTPTGKVGYLTFNDHNVVSELQLVNAITQLKAANISDLVLDLRYNGGGLLAIASELSYMIAGPAATSGKTFDQLIRNDKTPPEPATPFYSTAVGYDSKAGIGGKALPYLGLKRVTILTSANTCSASEAIINGLQGIDLEVNLIGAQTCGKPYGYNPTPNCGTTYFAIQFKGINNKGYGDYADGIPATCKVADDFSHALGDPAEAQLAAALSYRNTKTCPASSTGLQLRSEAMSSAMQLVRPMVKEIAIYSKPR
ncbi:peptidase S41 [Undibacterium sp. Jales W-56]|uniref:S41 family peptidase n=1 Tax=Undibacterium sp. Jales W-56 TaxID=2897325 RepID=UPI0021CF0F40|nr:S41 family peptidase [Undibacterium sp. Jales W-56]MCU6432424.1 peptidase S41 [Undibacterium sp. Jales W-56]